MTTRRTFRAADPGCVLVDVNLPAGTVKVIAEQGRERAEVVVSTPDATGPAADAVRLAEFAHIGDRLTVRVPAGATQAQQATGRGVNIGALALGGGVVNVGSVVAEQVSFGSGGVQINNFGGRQAVAASVAPVTVEVLVPAGSCLNVDGIATAVAAIGDLGTVQVTTVAGSVRLDAVEHARVATVSGRVEIARLHGEAWVKTVSGDIDVTADADSELTAIAMSGDIRAAGPIVCDASSRSGRVTTR